MDNEREQIEAAIAAIAAQRAVLGETVAELATQPLLARLASLLSPAPASAQSLKQVTILFLDVVGSTSIGQHLDPEDIHALMDGALAGCTRIVVAHHGKVLQYAGDSLLAVFGAEQSREDDAERAVRTGLALLEEGKRLGAVVQRDYGIAGFDVRVGVHTGGVLLGGGIDADGSIRGIAVNIAARLEQTASAGGLRISRDTQRQVRGLFETEPLPALQVKGIDEPVASFRVLGARPRSFGLEAREAAGSGGAESGVALVGRGAEMALLEQALEQARATRSVRWVTLAADAGIGKSRLLREFEARLSVPAARARRFHGRAQRYGINVPHGVVRDLVAWHCAIADSDSPDAARAKLQDVFGAPFGERGGEHSAFIGQLIGLDFAAHPSIAGIAKDGRQIRARALHAIAQFLRSQCAEEGSVVTLLLDDLHWADDGSLDLVEQLAASCADLPLLLGCFARPALFERRPGWRDGPAVTEHITLQPLGAESSGELVDALLVRLAAPPPELRALLLKSAEGNPFHLEEVLGMLVDEGVIVAAPEGWRADAARLRHMPVPTTLTAVLQARLDALPAAEKLALQRDSVIGHVFWDRALQRVAPDSVAALASLTARELIAQRASSAFAGMREYAFKHHLLHQVTYETVLKSERRALHKLTADWLVSATGERVGEHLGLIADHYERGGEALPAADYLQRAGEAAMHGAAFADALGYFDRSLALTPAGDHRMLFERNSLRASVCNSTGQRTEQGLHIERLEAHAEALDDDALRSRAAGARALHSLIVGRYREAIVEADRAIELAGRASPPKAAPASLLDKAQALIFLGEHENAVQSLETALVQTRALGMVVQEVVALNRLNAVAKQRGDLAAARGYLEPAIVVSRAMGERRFEGALLSNLAGLELAMGLLDEAAAHVEAGLAISRDIGDRGSVPYALGTWASVELARGRAEAALAMANEGRTVARTVGDPGVEADCELAIGRCQAALGDHSAARAAYDAHDAWANRQRNRDPAGLATMPPRVHLSLAQGRFDEASAVAAGMVAWLDAQPGGAGAADIARCYACHCALAAAGAPRAGEFIGHAWRLMQQQADRFDDAAQRSAFLDNVPGHREVRVAWDARNTPVSTDAG